MENFRILSFVWTLFTLCVLEKVNADEENAYIFTCQRTLQIGAQNKLQFQRYGQLESGKLTIKVTYTDKDNLQEEVASEKTHDIEGGAVDTHLELYLEPSQNYGRNGKIVINGTFGEYVIGGFANVYFGASRDKIVFIQTDKPLYKEGQTVKFRVLRVDKDLKPSVETNADVWVEDPQGTRLFQWKDISLVKGMQQFEFPLAHEPPKGDWKIRASFEGEVTTTTFKVKEYVLPKFEVKIKIPPFVLRNSEEIPISICAKYTYGKQVKGILRMNISFLRFSTGKDKRFPALENYGEIDGCFDYNINVSSIGTKGDQRFGELQISASVEESGTGVQRNISRFIPRYSTPLKFSFHSSETDFYKPGLPYTGRLLVKHPDKTPAADESVRICYKVDRRRVVMDRKRNRRVEFCRNYTSDEDGVIEFTIPRQNTNSTDIQIEAKSLKYVKDLGQSEIGMSLSPWFSPSGSFIQLQQVQETLLCGTKRRIKLLFTSKTDADFKFHYQVLHQGNVVQRGTVEKSFSASDDVSYRYEEKNIVVNDTDVHLVTVIDPSQLPESAEEESKSSEEARYIPLLGEVDFEIDIDPSLSPSFHLLTYYIRDDRETVADSQKFSVEKCYKNQVKLQFGDDVKQPGTRTSIRVTSSPNSLCGIKVVDKSVTLLDSDDQLTTEKIFGILESFDSVMHDSADHCNEKVRQPGLYKSENGAILPPRPRWSRLSSSYEDSLSAFENAGFLVISDLVLFSRPCEPEEYDEEDFIPRRVYFRPRTSLSRSKPVAPQAGPPAAKKMGDFGTKSVVDVRDYFPDTWLFDLEMTGPDGVYQAKEKLPHTITEWVGNAVCISDENGLGLSKTTSIKGFQAFFISTTLPYSVIRGEFFWITVSIFSYVDKPLPITVFLGELDGFEITSESIDGDICISPGSSTNLKIQLKGTALGKLNITVRAETAESSDVCGSSEVSDSLAKDAVTNSMIVEAEGWPAEDIKSILVCPKGEENGVFKTKFTLTEPKDVVPDSARAYVDVTGNVLGKSLDNLERLVQLPTGCGEQNMIKFAPNVVVMNVLIETNQLANKMKNRIARNLNTGAQRQLQYRHPDGSFSAFGLKDKEGSMFLTAFVLRYFSQASKYIMIDNGTIVQMQNWITSKQEASGCFPDVGKIIHREFQGAIGENKSQGTITAYVLASLLISGYQNQRVLDLALSCIEKSKDSNLYATFLFAYAESLAGKVDAAKERVKSVKDKAIKNGTSEHYHDINDTKEQNIETSSYAILSILNSGGSASGALPIIKYLTQNMNPRGGFYSTQDTVVALEALGQFSKLTFKDTVSITVTARGGLEKEIEITEDEKLIVKRYKVEKVPSEVDVEAKGTGCAVIQNVFRYNIKTPPEKRSFNLDVASKCLDGTCNSRSISVSVSYIPEGKKTGMALLEVKMISGVSPVKESLEALLSDEVLNLMRYDVENNVVVFYFNEITNSDKRFTFEVEEVIPVENSQPGTITVYDYYNKDVSSSTSYTLENCAGTSSCSKG